MAGDKVVGINHQGPNFVFYIFSQSTISQEKLTQI